MKTFKSLKGQNENIECWPYSQLHDETDLNMYYRSVISYQSKSDTRLLIFACNKILTNSKMKSLVHLFDILLSSACGRRVEYDQRFSDWVAPFPHSPHSPPSPPSNSSMLPLHIPSLLPTSLRARELGATIIISIIHTEFQTCNSNIEYYRILSCRFEFSTFRLTKNSRYSNLESLKED